MWLLVFMYRIIVNILSDAIGKCFKMTCSLAEFVVKCISPEIEAQAKAKLKEWFGEYDELEIADVIH